MLQYTTNLANRPPVSADDRSAAIAAMRGRSPYSGYGSSHADVLAALGGENAEAYDRAASRANIDYEQKRNEAQRQLALAGLSQMAKQQEDERQMASSRMSQITGMAGGLLGGLFK